MANCRNCHAEAMPRARYCFVCGLPFAADSPEGQPDNRLLPRPTPSALVVPAVAERRVLTIVFCDLVGSTELSIYLDPEDLSEIIGAYQRCVTQAATAFGGFVADYMGDGTMLYFGYPEASEFAAEGAVYAGLEALQAVSSLSSLSIGRKLRARVGIATGVVVVGDISGHGHPRALGALGETPNLAARLQGVAEPDTMVIDYNTHRMVGSLFEDRYLGNLLIKGVSRPVPAWQIIRPNISASRFQARQTLDNVAPIVGRDAALSRLCALWRKTIEGHGQAVLICGEAGIGKSRLVAELLAVIGEAQNACIQYACSPHQQGSPLYPYIQQLEHAAGFSHIDSPERRLGKLRIALDQVAGEDLALLAELLMLPSATSLHGDLPKLTPQRRRDGTMQALLNLLERMSRHKPVLMVLEDAHWSDPTTRELLHLTIERVAVLPIMVVVTSRPEFQPGWAEHLPHVGVIRLESLLRQDSAALVRSVAGSSSLPAALMEHIVERTDGIPLFIEELTKATLETTAITTPASTSGKNVSYFSQTVPATLHASLLARLDRLGLAKEVAQVAATIGRDFSQQLLRLLLDLDDTVIARTLDRLVEAGLVFPQGAASSGSYRFKHALVQDAAYSTMLRQRRRDLHRQIARTLEECFPDTKVAQPQILAYHYTIGGPVEAAVGYWLQAGRQALARSAMAEAIAQVRRGLELLAGLPDTDWRARRELDLCITLGKALIATQGYAVASIGENFARARDLCERLLRPPEMLSVMHGLWTHALMRGDLAAARKQAQDLLTDGEANHDQIWVLMGCRFLGVTCQPLGAFRRAREYLERGLRLFDASQRGLYAGYTVDDTKVVMLMYLSWALLCLGEIDDARQRCHAALCEAEVLGQPYTLAHALIGAAFVELTAGAPDVALGLLARLLSLAKEHGVAYYYATATILKGWCLHAIGEPDESLELLQSGLQGYRSTGTILYMPSLLRMSAEVHGQKGRLAEAHDQINEAIRLMDETKAFWDKAEIYRVKGDLLLAAGDHDGAEVAFRMAHATAVDQEARLWELRAATSIVQLHRRHRPAEATALLASACKRFPSHLDMVDLQHARAVLANLQ